MGDFVIKRREQIAISFRKQRFILRAESFAACFVKDKTRKRERRGVRKHFENKIGFRHQAILQDHNFLRTEILTKLYTGLHTLPTRFRWEKCESLISVTERACEYPRERNQESMYHDASREHLCAHNNVHKLYYIKLFIIVKFHNVIANYSFKW